MADSKEVVWLGSSLKDLLDIPEESRREVGFALWEAQNGKRHVHAKPLLGFRGASVLEIVEDFDTDAYRAVYTVKFVEAVYVLHCFQKKSKSGIGIPKRDLGLIKERFKQAEKEHNEWQRQQNTQRAALPSAQMGPKRHRAKSPRRER